MIALKISEALQGVPANVALVILVGLGAGVLAGMWVFHQIDTRDRVQRQVSHHLKATYNALVDLHRKRGEVTEPDSLDLAAMHVQASLVLLGVFPSGEEQG